MSVKSKILLIAGLLLLVPIIAAIFYLTVFKDDSAKQVKTAKIAPMDDTSQMQQTSDQGLTQENPDQSAAAQTIGGNSQPTPSQQPSQIDPATFSQYEKYKDAQQALYADIEKGTGTELSSGKTAAVVYKGWLTNGTVFDQSRADSSGKIQPFTFTLGAHQVIAGWEQAMSGMKVGGSRLLIVPPATGYGSAQTGPIPPNSVLIFEVQLVAVQ